jgi:hypothetical protein
MSSIVIDTNLLYGVRHVRLSLALLPTKVPVPVQLRARAKSAMSGEVAGSAGGPPPREGLPFDIGATWATLADEASRTTPLEHWGLMHAKIRRERNSHRSDADTACG